MVRRQFQNKKGIKAAIKRDNPGVEDLTTVPRWARVTELNHAITNAKIDASRLLAQEIVATAVAYDNCLIMMEDLSWSGDWWGEPYGVLLHWTEHYAESVGLHVMKVNPAWTSTSCSVCGAVRDGWIMGSSEAWVTSRLVAFSNKRDASANNQSMTHRNSCAGFAVNDPSSCFFLRPAV